MALTTGSAKKNSQVSITWIALQQTHKLLVITKNGLTIDAFNINQGALGNNWKSLHDQ
jgi:hypothetical protein